MKIEPVTSEELKASLPAFRQNAKQSTSSTPLPLALKVRCGIVDYILSGGTLSEERLYQLIAAMPLDI